MRQQFTRLVTPLLVGASSVLFLAVGFVYVRSYWVWDHKLTAVDPPPDSAVNGPFGVLPTQPRQYRGAEVAVGHMMLQAGRNPWRPAPLT